MIEYDLLKAIHQKYVFFGQVNTQNSRLGNSLSWMLSVAPAFRENGFATCFIEPPSLIGALMKETTSWAVQFDQCAKFFKALFKQECTTNSFNSILTTSFTRTDLGQITTPAGNKQIFIRINGVLVALLKYYTREQVDISFLKHFDCVLIHEPFYIDMDCSNQSVSTSVTELFPAETTRSVYSKNEDLIMNGVLRIGFHIRRTDYRFFNNGIWYYSDKFWEALSRKFKGRQSRIYLFSDEPLSDLTHKLRNDDTTITNGDALSDFLILMHMDLIVGPPSTFSNMAAKLAPILFEGCSPLILQPGDMNWLQ